MTGQPVPDHVAFRDQLDAAARQTFDQFLESAERDGQAPVRSPELCERVVDVLKTRSMEACLHVPGSPAAVTASLWNSRLECPACSEDNPPPRSDPASRCTFCALPSPQRLGLVIVPWSFVTIYALVCVDCFEDYR